MATLSSKAARPEYTILKSLSAETFLVRRHIDNELLLGQLFDVARWPEMKHLNTLLNKGAGTPVSNILNHVNLISIAGSMTNFPFAGGARGGEDGARVLLFDYCDAGTLDALFRNPPVRPSKTGFLPESLVWHVLLSMLRALAWLHDGYRADNAAVREEPDVASQQMNDQGEVVKTTSKGETSGHVEFRQWIADPDWLPILHRNIRPENIYFQQPRGSETYGLCKLGNFGDAFVSGHVNWVSGGAVVAMQEKDVSLLEMKERMAVANIYTLDKTHRPYTRGSELFALGAILYRMMTGSRLPDPEECNLCACRHLDDSADECPHECHDAIDISGPFDGKADYTCGLKDFVASLLKLNRSDVVSSSELIEQAENGFCAWKETTEDGKLYVDLEDDLAMRMVNQRKKAETEAKEEGLISVGVL